MFASTAAQVVDQSKGRSRRGGGFSVAGRRAWRAGALSAAAVLVGVAALPAAASAQVSLFGPTSYELGAGTAPTSVAVDDFNGVYGDVDLAVANQGTDNVSLLLGNGNGGFDKPPFGTPRTVAVGDAPSAVAAGEFNHNAKRDLAVVNGGSNNVSVLLGNGNAGFSLASTVGVGNAPSSVAVGYFNQDGHPDLAVANGGDGTVSVLAGDENGGFSLASTANVGSNPSSVAVGDFDGRNGPDLAVANRGSTYVSVLLNQGNGSFNQGSNVTLSDYNPTSVAVGDFDGRNGPDLAIAKTGFWGQVSVALGNGNGSFGSATLYWQGEYQVVPNSVAVADFNGDDKPDVGFDDGSSNVRVLLNNFGGSGGVNFYKAASRTVAGGPNSLAVGDFGSDSDADLAVANQGSNNVDRSEHAARRGRTRRAGQRHGPRPRRADGCSGVGAGTRGGLHAEPRRLLPVQAQRRLQRQRLVQLHGLGRPRRLERGHRHAHRQAGRLSNRHQRSTRAALGRPFVVLGGDEPDVEEPTT